MRIEAIITQLVFEHALRMRVKADVKDEPDHEEDDVVASGTTTAAGGSSVTARRVETNNNDGVTSANKGKQKSTAKAASATSPRTKNARANTAGRINNLITSDLASLSLCREFLAIRALIPPLPLQQPCT